MADSGVADVSGLEMNAAGPGVATGRFGERLQFFQGLFAFAQLQPKLRTAHGDCFTQGQTARGELVEVERELLGWRWGRLAACAPGHAPGKFPGEETEGGFYCHAVSLKEGVGHWRSKGINKSGTAEPVNAAVLENAGGRRERKGIREANIQRQPWRAPECRVGRSNELTRNRRSGVTNPLKEGVSICAGCR